MINNDFWLTSGWHLLDKNSEGHLVPTEDFMRAYFYRPEVAPIEESCPAEIELHKRLIDNPFVNIEKNDLGQYLMDKYGAPTKEIATKAASEEISLMLELCKDHEKGSLLSISREWTKEGIKEKYRNLPKAESCAEQKIWTVVEED